MSRTTFTGVLTKAGSPAESIDVEFDLEGDTLALSHRGDELASWPVSQVKLVRARLLVEFDTEAWWIEPDDSAAFIGRIARLLDSWGRPGRSERANRVASLGGRLLEAARAYRRWRMSSSGADLAIVVGGLATIGLAVMVGSGLAALLGAWGAGVATYAIVRVAFRMHDARRQVIGITRSEMTEPKKVAPPGRSGLHGAEDEFARLLGESLRSQVGSPGSSPIKGVRGTEPTGDDADPLVSGKRRQSGE